MSEPPVVPDVFLSVGVTPPADLRPIKWQLYLSVVGLGLGVLMGLLQAFERRYFRWRQAVEAA